MRSIIIRIIPFGLLLLTLGVGYSQQTDIHLLKEKEQQIDVAIKTEESQQLKFMNQSDSLAASIQLLKSRDNINIFQRQKLEQLLKSSQQLDQKLSEVNRKLSLCREQHQLVLKQLIVWYDNQIENLLNFEKEKKLSSQRQRDHYQQILNLKTERDNYLKKVMFNSIGFQLSKPISIQDSDNYETIKQKADLLKDQEDKIRKQLKLVNKKVEDVQKEIKLRNRMNELIADTYLMDQPTEKFLPQNQDKGAIDNAVFSETGERNVQTNASFDVVDNLLLKTDISNISNLDLESYVRNLQQMKVRLNQSADSLHSAADQFYQAAEKKRQNETKK